MRVCTPGTRGDAFYTGGWLFPVVLVLCSFWLAAHDGRVLAQEPAGNELAEQEAKIAPLGSFENPIRCDDPDGERFYLSRLVDPQGREIKFGRMGSYGVGPYGNILDGYFLTFGDQRVEVFMDMYHGGYYEDRPIEGFYLRCRMSWDLLIQSDGLRYKAGADKPYDGEYTTVDEETGRIKAKVTVREGLLQGVATRYNEDGSISKVVPYTDSLEQGTAYYFDDEGQLNTTINYRRGMRHGEATWHRPDGSIESLYTYVEGVLQGTHYSTFDNGSKRCVGQFEDGERVGEWVYHNAEGNVTQRETYKDGKRVELVNEAAGDGDSGKEEGESD